MSEMQYNMGVLTHALIHLICSKDVKCILMFQVNAKRCVCYAQLCSKTTFTSSVNERQVFIINDNDLV